MPSVVDVLEYKDAAARALFPLVDADDVKGGMRAVANVTARDAIPAGHRAEGMTVYVASLGRYDRLQADLTTWSQGAFGANLTGISALTALDVSQLPAGNIQEVSDISRGGSFVLTDAPYTADNGIIFAPSTVSGNLHWVRSVTGPVEFSWFAPARDGATDDSAAMQSFIAAVNTYGRGHIGPGGIIKLASRVDLTITRDILLDLDGAHLQGATTTGGADYTETLLRLTDYTLTYNVEILGGGQRGVLDQSTGLTDVGGQHNTGLDTRGFASVIVDGVDFLGSPDGEDYNENNSDSGWTAEGPVFAKARNCRFVGWADNGIYWSGTSTSGATDTGFGFVSEGNYFERNANGISIKRDGHGLRSVGDTFRSNLVDVSELETSTGFGTGTGTQITSSDSVGVARSHYLGTASHSPILNGVNVKNWGYWPDIGAVTSFAAAPAPRAATHTLVTIGTDIEMVSRAPNYVRIDGTTNYDGAWVPTQTTATTFEIETPFVADDAAGSARISTNDNAVAIRFQGVDAPQVIGGRISMDGIGHTPDHEAILLENFTDLDSVAHTSGGGVVMGTQIDDTYYAIREATGVGPSYFHWHEGANVNDRDQRNNTASINQVVNEAGQMRVFANAVEAMRIDGNGPSFNRLALIGGATAITSITTDLSAGGANALCTAAGTLSYLQSQTTLGSVGVVNIDAAAKNIIDFVDPDFQQGDTTNNMASSIPASTMIVTATVDNAGTPITATYTMAVDASGDIHDLLEVSKNANLSLQVNGGNASVLQIVQATGTDDLTATVSFRPLS